MSYLQLPIISGDADDDLDDEGTNITCMFKPFRSLTYEVLCTSCLDERRVHELYKLQVRLKLLYCLDFTQIAIVSLNSYLPDSTAEQIAEVSVLYPDNPAEILGQFKRLAAFQGDYAFIGGRHFLLEHA
ncbi:hypothetical protein GGX14DRAFT_571743 [Mycena pura]|uniref:Uncharacterized protein n=1 Tax=Mycena pura TaxID=153505 RepID=A0AAD6Y9R8_9AGAR|nr:hypothetical protein GGX14DRAFT_571743 [Mycena pura]